jgi:thioredoxin-related protein
LFSILLIKNFLPASPQPIEDRSPRSLIGTTLSNTGIDWTQRQQTLLLVLRKGCHFCDESAPFYQRLTRELSANEKTHLVAVLPSKDEESKQYLKEKNLEINDVRQLPARSLGVKGTPTLLLVDTKGVVVNEWLGKLSADQEQNVIARLNQ